MTPELVIFDMDGLIFDSERLFMKCLIEEAAKHGYTITKDMYIDTMGLAGDNLVKKMYSYFGDDYPFRLISEQARASMNNIVNIQGLPVKKGILPLLKHLQDKEISCCVCSSSPERYVEAYLDRAELSTYFQYIAGGDMVKRSKPAPDIFLLACEHFNISPEKCVVLEDSYNGICAACNANIPAICIPDLKIPDEEMTKKAALIVESADRLIDII